MSYDLRKGEQVFYFDFFLSIFFIFTKFSKKMNKSCGYKKDYRFLTFHFVSKLKY